MATAQGQPPIAKADLFGRIANWMTRVTGGKWAFLTAVGIIVVWGVCGPIFKYSDTWQLVINTGTTIVTFLMVFLIQNSQNRESKAVHLKLDELIKAVKHAGNEMIDIECLTDEQLDHLRDRYRKIAEQHRPKLEAELAACADPKAGRIVEKVEAIDAQLDRVERKVEEAVSRN